MKWLALTMPMLQGAAHGQNLQIILPLYNYPNWWDQEQYVWPQVAEARHQVPITAIINPNNGPDGGPPNTDYRQGMQLLRAAGVTLLGYVSTQYGERKAQEVMSDIDLYAKYFPVDGIFLDEVSNDLAFKEHYRHFKGHIEEKTSLDHTLLNPGTALPESYLSQQRPVGTAAVTFENTYGHWQDNVADPAHWAKGRSAEQFAALIYDVPHEKAMRRVVDLAAERNYGYVYATDHRGENPWNRLPSYWGQLVQYVQRVNTQR